MEHKLKTDFELKFKGSTSPKPPMKYTGNNMLGIVTNHKSNAQPVFSIQAAKDSVRVK
jgi:hypothetical protein